MPCSYQMRCELLLRRGMCRAMSTMRTSTSETSLVVWRPTLSYSPPEEWKSSLSEMERSRLSRLMAELRVLSQIYTFMPSSLTQEQWAKLVRINSISERFSELKFFRMKEIKNSKEAVKMERKKAMNEDRTKRIYRDPDHCGYVGAWRLHEYEKTLQALRYCHSQLLEDTPKMVVDCRFLSQHSSCGRTLVFKQLSMLVAHNRARPCPWPVYLANFDETDPALRVLRKAHFGILETDMPTGELSSKSYLELFPQHAKEGRIVYLSPHATEDLEVVEPSTCYVLGGIVDRVHEPLIPKQASLLTAEEEGIPARRLPLDKHIEWKRGVNKYLTLTSVAGMLQDVFDSGGDWGTTLEKYTPVRKRKDYKPNADIQKVHDTRREYNRQALSLLIEILGDGREEYGWSAHTSTERTSPLDAVDC